VLTADAAVPAAAPATPPVTHLVRQGETLALIARRYRVSVDQLVAVNGLLSANRIFPGQRLKIPTEGAPAQPAAAPIGVDASPEVTLATADLGGSEATRQHVVRKGDSLARIARRYSVSVEDIRSRNELGSSLIHPGQVLEIPSKN
jgi:membrane-bound lytic murein transglycosylase D